MPPTRDWELSYHRSRKVRSILSFISAESWSQPRGITLRWKRRPGRQMGSPGAALLPPWPEVHPGHRPRTPSVDGSSQGHQCQGDPMVPRAPGLPLCCASSGWSRERQRRRSLTDLGSFHRSVRGSYPHPPPNFPLLSHCANRTRTTLRGGECDEWPKAHQRRPGKHARNTCPT